MLVTGVLHHKYRRRVHVLVFSDYANVAYERDTLRERVYVGTISCGNGRNATLNRGFPTYPILLLRAIQPSCLEA